MSEIFLFAKDEEAFKRFYELFKQDFLENVNKTPWATLLQKRSSCGRVRFSMHFL
jgi:hypothetical protein